jgi:hypothetical protein
MPHIRRCQHDQGNQDDAGERPELAGLRGEASIHAAHNLIGLRRVSDLILTLLGCRALKIERLRILSSYRHVQFLFPVLPE